MTDAVQLNRCWEALDRFRNAYRRRQHLARILEEADEEMRDAEGDALLVFAANGYPPKVAIGGDIVECRRSGPGPAVLVVVAPEDIPGVHSLKDPFEGLPAEAEVEDF